MSRRGLRSRTGATSRTPAELLDEENHLRRSLEDLDREQAAGDLAIEDYDELRARYTARAGEVAAALAGLGDDAPAEPAESRSRRNARPTPRKRRRGVAFAGVGCLLAAGLIGGLALAGVAPFAKPAPGLPVSTRIQIELAEASVLASANGGTEVSQAIATYADVLQLDPRQPEALADGGWLVRAVGLSTANDKLVASGGAQIAMAVKVAPGYELARAYYGVVLYVDDNDPKSAVVQFNALAKQLDAMAKDKRPKSLVSLVHTTAAAAYSAAGETLPAALASGAA
ncbi:MAG: hypothetical protein ACRD0Z_13470 [Acidimicrobiales bacterium]